MPVKYIKLMKRKAISLLIDVIRIFSPVLSVKLRYFRLFKRPLNDKNPQLFAEKIIVRMNSKEYEQFEKYADKWKVREYIKEVIGEEYLIPMLAVYDKPEDVRYEQIPENAYLKLNHGSGYNVVYTKEKEAQIKKKIRKWFRTDFSRNAREQQYKNIKRKILVEKNIASDREPLYDYSFFTFRGKVEFAQIRDNAGHRYEVGRNYEKLPYQLFSTVTPIEPKKPEYDKMVVLAEKLAHPFDFVRVDFFCVEHKIYFGELTFAPGAGIRMFKPYEYNLILGEKIP